MNVKSKKQLASRVLGVGIHRVRIDSESLDDVSKALTRDDIRHHISTGAIFVEPEKPKSRGRLKEAKKQKKKGRRRGYGSRKGTKNARDPKKKRWMRKIRAIRGELKQMREDEEVDAHTYRTLYRQAKGNLFHSRRHLREHIERAKT